MDRNEFLNFLINKKIQVLNALQSDRLRILKFLSSVYIPAQKEKFDHRAQTLFDNYVASCHADIRDKQEELKEVNNAIEFAQLHIDLLKQMLGGNNDSA